MKAVQLLKDAGYDTIVFHAVGSGGRAMEQMIKEGIIGALLLRRINNPLVKNYFYKKNFEL